MATENRLVILKRANKFFRQKKIEPAIKEYKKVLDIKPDDLEIRRIIGDLQLKINKIPEAVEQFEWIADYYLREGFFARSIAMYKRITRIRPNYEKASFKLAELYSKQGLIIEAKQIYLDLADEFKRKNNPKQSLDMYKKILEFDRNNLKMRLLLAENYLRENLKEQAVTEFVISADILMNKKEFQKAEELLLDTLKKITDLKIVRKLVQCFKAQDDSQKAIKFLESLGGEIFKHIDLLKTLGELYFNSNKIEDAEKIFIKIVDINPQESEIILKLGKVYLHREEYDRTFKLFLPLVDKNIKEDKIEEATSLLRFIIASNNSYLPALSKLAEIFKQTGKKNNLIALYESMIPIYEGKDMLEELKKILDELIKLSDSPFTYEEQLARLTGKEMEIESEGEGEQDEQREIEFINFNLRLVDDALKISDYDKAISILSKSKATFPQNIEIRSKMFEVFQLTEDVESALNEGKELLNLYKLASRDSEYNTLLNQLSVMKPDDENLAILSQEEETHIDIDFSKDELEEQFSEMSDAKIPAPEMEPATAPESDVFVLSDANNITEIHSKKEKSSNKSFSALLTELDFYINDGYFGDAEKLVEKLRANYPDNKLLLEKITKLNQAREGKPVPDPKEASQTSDIAFDIDPMSSSDEISGPSEPEIAFDNLDEKVEIGMPETDISPLGDSATFPEAGTPEPEPEIPLESEEIIDLADDDQVIELENMAEAPGNDHMFEDSSVKADAEDMEGIELNIEESEDEELEFQLEDEEVPFDGIEVDQIIDNQETEAEDKGTGKHSSSTSEFLDIDTIMEEADSDANMESPFKDIESQQVVDYESDSDILGEELPIIDDDLYFNVGENIQSEFKSIEFWLKELERQRTSTIEKNMMEIFEEFKKGVDEKIGQEDYDTRYNLGIAYKEMGLLEEAIHEFLISAKHPLKFFDSAGLLGICFKEKGMFDEAVSWFEKSLETPDRKEEEYMAIKYEMVLALKSKENYTYAIKLVEDIMAKDEKFRDIKELYQELKDQNKNLE